MSETATIEAPAQTTTADTSAAERSARKDAAAKAVVAAIQGGGITLEKVNAAKAELDAPTQAPPTKAESKSSAKAADDASAATEKPKPGPKPGEKAEREARENEALAKHALKREGFDDEEIDRMNPDDRITVGLKLKAKQDAAQREFEQPKTTQTGTPAKDREGEGAQRRPADPRESAGQPQLDPGRDGPESEELARVFETLDDDNREILSKHITADLTRAEREVLKARKEAATARQELFEVRQKAERTALERDFPQIAEDERFGEVETLMEQMLGKKAKWPTLDPEYVRSRMSLAAAAVFGREAIKAARAERTKELSDDLAGQPHVGGTKSSDRATQASKKDLAARAVVEASGDNAEARKKFERYRGL